MALKDIEFCDAQARESMATGLGRGVSRRIMDCRRLRADFEEMADLTVTTLSIRQRQRMPRFT
jgi:hypothetical protein